MHALAVVQHNLVTVHSGGEHHEMLNVAKYIVKFFSADMIYLQQTDTDDKAKIEAEPREGGGRDVLC